jgi:hypothetical protein
MKKPLFSSSRGDRLWGPEVPVVRALDWHPPAIRKIYRQIPLRLDRLDRQMVRRGMLSWK